MKRLLKKEIWEEVYQILREECLSGKWDEKLPGARVLGKRLGVSPPTVLKAFGVLVNDGILARGGTKRAFRVRERGSKQKESRVEKVKTVLILSHMSLDQMVETTRRITRKLEKRLDQMGWRTRKLVVDFKNVSNVQKSWDRLIEVEDGMPMIVIYGNPVIADWALSRGVRFLFLGGELQGRAGSRIGVSSLDIAQSAMDLMMKCGHRYFILPLNNRGDELKQAIKGAMKRRVESLGEVYQPSYFNPESSSFSKDSIRTMFHRYVGPTFPTGMIFMDWKELLAAHCCLSRMGKRVPEDVSLILLNDQEEAAWFEPDLVRYSFPDEDFVSELLDWISDGSGRIKNVSLLPKFIDGGTVDCVARQ